MREQQVCSTCGTSSGTRSSSRLGAGGLGTVGEEHSAVAWQGQQQPMLLLGQSGPGWQRHSVYELRSTAGQAYVCGRTLPAVARAKCSIVTWMLQRQGSFRQQPFSHASSVAMAVAAGCSSWLAVAG